ncbi:hypothetical protein O6H91_06G069300 [Diphasiastrum complanatum]|uniref:Uncharacterized protein n=2 Tax=Diphasiastrum complanatum TaxID=34168 RepID=A0ACC2DET8_DIPCM|nr:hypothetical protein O6H91_06G069300 [Diphasiastrum complanatum]KAJ7552754.1 hypothetical protein O6H91_06G069300 [Diphasiastrum complanatum]
MGFTARTIASSRDATILHNSCAQMQGLPWKWILEKILEHKKISIRAAQGITSYIPDIEDQHCSSLQDRLALRYLEEIVEAELIDARAIPLVKALVREDINHKKLLLWVQTEASLQFLRGCKEEQEKDWVGFADALDHIFSEEDVDVGLVTRKTELSALLKDENRDHYCEEIFQKYPIATLRKDLLQFIREQKTSVESPFLDELVQDFSTGLYNLSSVQNKPPSKSSEVHCDVVLRCIHAPPAPIAQGHQLNLTPEQTKDIKNELQARLSSAMDGIDDETFSISLENTSEGRGTAEGHPTEVVIEDVDGSSGQRGNTSADLSEEMSLACRLRIMRSEKRQQNSLVDKHFNRRKMIDSRSRRVRNIPSTDNGKEFPGSGAELDKKTASTADTWQVNIDDKGGISDTQVIRGIDYSELGKDGHEEICHTCKTQGKLLYCHGCPVAVHLNCLEQSIGQNSQITGEIEWYCPICTYKKAVIAYDNAKKAALLAKKHMCSFIDTQEFHPECHDDCAVRDDVVCKVRGSNLLITAAPANQSIVDKVSSREKEIPSPDSHNIKGRSELRRLNSPDSDRRACSELHPVQTTALQKEVDGSYCPGSNIQGQDGDGRDKNLNVGHVSHFDFDPRGDPSEPSRKRVRRNFPGLRRKNLPWTKLEEEVLKEGIRRYSKGNGSWGFQWARILEYGYGKFHESRTSIDLKDKWRNLAKTFSWEA